MQLQHKANTMTILQGERDASRRTCQNVEQRMTRSLRPCDIYLEGPLDCRVGGIAEVRAMVRREGRGEEMGNEGQRTRGEGSFLGDQVLAS